MTAKHLDDIEVIALSLGSLKAQIGLSRIEDSDWEGIASALDDYSFRLRLAVKGLRMNMPDSETCRTCSCYRSQEMDNAGKDSHCVQGSSIQKKVMIL